MKYCTATVYIDKIKKFRENLKSIDIKKADKQRNGAYTVALKELDEILNNEVELDVITDPDNTLRCIMMLSEIDMKDASTKKEIAKKGKKRNIWQLEFNGEVIRIYRYGESICMVWKENGKLTAETGIDPRVPKYILKECMEIFDGK